MGDTTGPKVQWQPPKQLAAPGKVAVAFLAASGFRTCAQPFRAKMAGRSIHYKETLAPMDILQEVGEVAVSAANLAFSIELNLKGLQLASGQPGWGHELEPLYKALPQDLRDSIEAAYEATPKPAPPDTSHVVSV